MPLLETEVTEVLNPQLANTLVSKALEQEEQKNYLCNSDDSKFFTDDSDDTIDNSVKHFV